MFSIFYIGVVDGSINWLIIQVMACRLLGTKTLLEPVLTYCRLYHKKPFNDKNALEAIVYELAAIFSSGPFY